MIAVAAAGCTAGRAFSNGERAARSGDWDSAVLYYQQATQANPNSAEYKIALERAQLAASRNHIDKGQQLEAKDDIEGAIREYRKAAEFDPGNRRATTRAVELEKILRDKIEAARPKPQIEQLKDRARQTSQVPELNPASRQPLYFKFAQGVMVKQILDFLAQTSGINVMYDTTVQDKANPSALELDGVTLEQALNLVFTSNGFFYKVLNARTILVILDSPQNRQKYEDQVIRTFYLSSADATEMQTLLTQIIVPQGGVSISRPQISVNKGANTVTMRGSSAMVAIAERVIEMNDKPRAEVVVDVEILEVNRTRAKSYGLNLSNYAVGLNFSPEAPPSGSSGSTPGAGATATTSGGSFNLNTVVHGINTADFYLQVPSATIKFLESDSQTKLIAKPSLRGQEGTKLTANLGDEIPVPSTTFSPLVTGGTAFNPMTSFSYRSVGVNLEVTPRVTYDGDIILDLMVESSTKAADVNVAGQNLPSFGSRKVTTKMRLRDGESNMLAGLLRDDERKSLNGFPGGIHVPVIKQLFSANESQISQTDIVMLLTPHIIRTHGLTDRDFQPVYIGTSQNPTLGGTPPLLGVAGTDTTTDQPAGQPTAAPAQTPAPPITTQPYGTPGAAPVGGAPVGRQTQQGTPVIPPGSSPVPGTVMMPPAQQQPQAQPVAPPTMPAVQPPLPTAQPAGQVSAPSPAILQPAAPPPPAGAPAAAATPPRAAPLPPAVITVTPPGTELRVGGGPYTVALSGSAMNRASTLSLTLTYSPTALRVRTVQEGGFMKQGNATTAFAQQVDSANGRVDITITRTGDIVGATGDGMLAAVVFDAIAPGAVNFRISGVANGPSGVISLQFAPASVTVK
jgi:general secretion pathway protein D